MEKQVASIDEQRVACWWNWYQLVEPFRMMSVAYYQQFLPKLPPALAERTNDADAKSRPTR